MAVLAKVGPPALVFDYECPRGFYLVETQGGSLRHVLPQRMLTGVPGEVDLPLGILSPRAGTYMGRRPNLTDHLHLRVVLALPDQRHGPIGGRDCAVKELAEALCHL